MNEDTLMATVRDSRISEARNIIEYITRGKCLDEKGCMLPGMKRSPERFIQALHDEMCSGYDVTDDDIGKMLTQFDGEGHDELITLERVEFHSCCEHHILPFSGIAHIGYIPDKKIAGISKLARVLDVFANRLQNQERLCRQVTDALDKHLLPLGSACIIKASHSCVCSRGVGKQLSVMGTSSMTGVFRTKPEARAELLSLIGLSK